MRLALRPVLTYCPLLIIVNRSKGIVNDFPFISLRSKKNMKKQVIGALFGAAMALPFTAQAVQPYVGVSAVRSDVNDHHQSNSDGLTGAKLFGGINFNRIFGVQGGFVKLGSYDHEYSYYPSYKESYSRSTTAGYVAATFTLPLSPQLSLNSKIGVASLTSKTERTSVSSGSTYRSTESYDSADILAGIGAAFNISKQVTVFAEFEHFGNASNDKYRTGNASSYSLGLRYNF